MKKFLCSSFATVHVLNFIPPYTVKVTDNQINGNQSYANIVCKMGTYKKSTSPPTLQT